MKKHLAFKLLVCGLVVLAAPLLAAAPCGYSYTPLPQARQARIELAVQLSEPNWIADPASVRLIGLLYHNVALSEGGAAIASCLDLLGQHLAVSPDDVEALAYYSSCQIMESSNQVDLSRQLDLLSSAAARIDDCVTRCPDNVNVRLVRISATKRLLSLRGHKELISTDYKKILLLSVEHPELAPLLPEARAWLSENAAN